MVKRSLLLLYMIGLLVRGRGQHFSAPGPSPCPSVFSYDGALSRAGLWYGRIEISTAVRLYGLWIDIILDNTATSLTSSFGDVTTTDNKSFKIENTRQYLNSGTKSQVTISVEYDSYSTVPKLKILRLNGQDICHTSSIKPVAIPKQGNYDNQNDGMVNYNGQNSRTGNSGTHNAGSRSNHREIYATGNVHRSDTGDSGYPVTGNVNEDDGFSVREPQGTSIFNQNSRGNGRDVYADNFGRGSLGNGDIRGGNRDTPRKSTTDTPAQDTFYDSSYNDRRSTSRPVNSHEYPNQGTKTTLRRQYPPSRTPGNAGFEHSSTRIVPLSPINSNDGRSSRRPQTSSTGTQTHRGLPHLDSGDYDDMTDTDQIDVEPSSTTRKPIRNSGTSTSNDYFQGDHKIPEDSKIYPTPPHSRLDEENESCGVVATQATPLIVNGQLAKQGQWPWHVALYQSQTVDSKYICGGSLVSLSHVLTAAHCVTRTSTQRSVNAQTLTIYLGKFNLRKASEGVQIMFVRKIYVHPEYNASNFFADLAILKFTKPSEYSNVVRPICLWKDYESDLSYVVGKEGSVVGWGFDENNRLTEELAMVKMPVVDQLTCIWSFRDFFSHFTSNYSFCAGFANGTSVCNGDSGGGMVFSEKTGYGGNTETWYLRGLVSISVAKQSDSICDPNHYVVFTDIAQYLTWVKQIIQR